MASIAGYKPRPVAGLGRWSFGDWSFKVYGIREALPAGGGPLIADDMLEAARQFAEAQIPAMQGTPHRNVGFVVLHAGSLGNWLLVHWWAHEDICCQILGKSEKDSPLDFRQVEQPFMACVWELVPIEHERRAWVECVLERDDIDAYLHDWLPEGDY